MTQLLKRIPPSLLSHSQSTREPCWHNLYPAPQICSLLSDSSTQPTPAWPPPSIPHLDTCKGLLMVLLLPLLLSTTQKRLFNRLMRPYHSLRKRCSCFLLALWMKFKLLWPRTHDHCGPLSPYLLPPCLLLIVLQPHRPSLSDCIMLCSFLLKAFIHAILPARSVLPCSLKVGCFRTMQVSAYI